MNNDLIIEIGTEELPNSFLNHIDSSLHNIVTDILKDLRITYKQIEIYYTPRRLLIMVSELADKQEDITTEKQGPPHRLFYENDQLTDLGEKFLKAQNIKEKELLIKDTKKGKYIFTVIHEKGRSTKEFLQEILDSVLKQIHLTKTMRWDSSQYEFLRPIRWLVTCYQEKNIDTKIGNVKSSAFSYGHRFLADNKKIKFENITQTKKILTDHHIIYDQNKRKLVIKDNIKKALPKGYSILENEELFKEVTNLVEYPFVQLCEFDKDFLIIPAEFISTAIIHHQRAFPIYHNNKITNKFIVILNTKSNDQIKLGNEKVLRARLNDAKFFVEEDTKNKKLSDFNEKLSTILYLNNLGTMKHKVNRIQQCSESICNYLGLSNAINDVKQTAQLCKADLASAIVYEFPELQGIAGMLYAEKEGLNKNIAKGINEHYKPRFADDNLPKEITGTVVGLADKIDSIVGCFIKGFIPSGSEDPYQIRRYSLAIINIILKNKLNLDIKVIVNSAYGFYYKQNLIEKQQDEDVIIQILNYVKTRYKTVLLEMDFKHDEIESIINLDSFDFLDLNKRLSVLKQFRKNEKFKDLLIALKRMTNIIKGQQIDKKVQESLFKEKEEKELHALFNEKINIFNKYINEKDYQKAFNLLSEYKDTVDLFFDKVLVMDKNEDLKNNRLALLKKLVNHFTQLMDFSCVSG